MDGLVVRKTDMARNEWCAEWDGDYSCDLADVGFEVEHGHTIDIAIDEAWTTANGEGPTSNQRFWLRTAILVLDTWYEGGAILTPGRYIVVGDHIKVARTED